MSIHPQPSTHQPARLSVCPNCKGDGYQWFWTPMSPEGTEDFCARCLGSGRVVVRHTPDELMDALLEEIAALNVRRSHDALDRVLDAGRALQEGQAA